MKPEPRIAFITDALPAIGGGEKTLFAALECFPDADVFTLIYNKDRFIHTPLEKRRVITSYLDRFPLARKRHRLFLPLMPQAVQRFNLRGYDVVVSLHYAVANGVNANGAKHLSYTYTPMRYAWGGVSINGKNSHNNALVDRYLSSFREWDRTAASRIHNFAAISNGVAQRIWSAYQREAQVIYPPVEVERFHSGRRRKEYYVVLSRLVTHKRVDVIVEAFSRLKLPLKIIGDGPEKNRLSKRASKNIEFLGFQPDEHVAQILGRARGFISAAEEDFGIALVEAQAAGCPVITYDKGGALETVINGSTGLFYSEQSPLSLMEAVRVFEDKALGANVNDLTNNARRFDKANFKKRFERFIKEALV
jgi:glycosyltransferase involved in cell wall biosynthesis